MQRHAEDPETWVNLRSRQREIMAILIEDDESLGFRFDMTGTIAETDRSMAAMRDAGLDTGQAAIMSFLMALKTFRQAVPETYTLLHATDALIPAILISAIIMEVLETQ